LQWTHVLGNATVKGTFGKRSYDLQVGTLQAVALMAFNLSSGDSSSSGCASTSSSACSAKPFSNLLDTLGMPDEILKRVMHSLSCGKYKVLKRLSATSDADTSSGDKDKGVIKSTDSFVFNESFT
jgi:cullin 1